MINKLLAKIIPFIFILGCLSHIKEVEKCMLEALKPSSPGYLYLSDLKMLASAALEFQILPVEVQNALRACYATIENGTCEDKFRTGQYEDCGIFMVPKCESGYKRVDCSICAKECPEGTLTDAAGMLCQKPKVIGRKQYVSQHSCVAHNEECVSYGKVVVTKCPKNFVPLGMFMCIYECLDDFTDEGVFCVPPSMESNEYCMNTFHERMGGFKQASK